MEKNLGHATAYGYAKSKGYSGTEDEYAELMADYASVGQSAAESAEQAAASATSASGSAATASQAAQTATEKSSDAIIAEGVATAKAEDAQAYATSANQSAESASTSAQTATAKAGTATAKADEAAASEAAALSAKADAETARDAAAQSASKAAESARTLTIDATLTQSGQAADAKATGDKIGSLKSALDEINDFTADGFIAIREAFQHGSINNIADDDTITANSQTNRAYNPTPIVADGYIEIKIRSGFRCYVYRKRDNLSWAGLGWSTGDIIVSAKRGLILVIARETEVTGEYIEIGTLKSAVRVTAEISEQYIKSDKFTALGEQGIMYFDASKFNFGYVNSDGTVDNDRRYRVVSTFLSYSYPLNLILTDADYQYQVFYYENEEFTASSGWKTGEYTIPANNQFRLLIKWSEETSTTIADVPAWAEKVAIKSPVIEDLRDDIVQIQDDIVQIQPGVKRLKELNCLITQSDIEKGTWIEDASSHDVIKQNHGSRYRNKGAISFEKNVILHVREGYSVYVYYEDASAEYGHRGSGWITEFFNLPSNSGLHIVIRKNPEESITLDEAYNAMWIDDGQIDYDKLYRAEIDAIKWNLATVRDSDSLVFAVTTDNHYNTTDRNSMQTEYAKVYSKVAEELGCEFQMNLGDIITERGTENQNCNNMASMSMAFNKSYVPFMYAIGHHELYPYVDEENDEAVYLVDKKKAIGTLGAFTRWVQCVYQDDNPFSASFYADFHRQRIRVISIDSVSRTYAGYSRTVLDFVKNKALSSVPQGYKVILFSHVPSRGTANEHGYYPWNGSEKDGTKVESGVEPLEQIVNAFIEAGGTVLCHIHGHTHWDNIVKDDDLPYPLISVCCASLYKLNLTDAVVNGVNGNPTVYDRNANDYTAFCMDIFCVHADTGAIQVFRFGVGTNRTYIPS